MSKSDIASVDVLIVGLGPVGATIANLLGRYGVKALVIDKATEIFRAPRAIALDNEALRVLQMAGIEEGAFQTVAIPSVRMRSPMFGEYGRVKAAGALDGHPKLVTFFQPELEAVLRARLGHYSNIEVRTGVALISLAEEADGVSAICRTEGGQEFTIQARYVVGADGASSNVREMAGMAFDGQTFMQDWLVVDALNVPTPIDDVEFLCDPKRPTPHMVAPGGRQRWEFMLRPGETREEMEHPDMVRRLLAPWAQMSDIEIERVAVYRFHARVAERFSKGRIFLAGDAAHITPPFAGQGLVAGLRDAANLSWKLAWVIKGMAAPAILKTYDEERRPHAKAIIQLALFMGRLVMPQGRITAFLTHGLMMAARLIPRLKRVFSELEIKPKNEFGSGLFVAPTRGSKVRRGGTLPQGWLRATATGEIGLSDDMLGTELCIVGFGMDPFAGLAPSLASRWQKAGGKSVAIVQRGAMSTAPADAYEDIAGVFVPDIAVTGWVAVVRPDRTIIVDGPASECADLMEASLRLLRAV